MLEQPRRAGGAQRSLKAILRLPQGTADVPLASGDLGVAHGLLDG
jgi:hypothetical protein